MIRKETNSEREERERDEAADQALLRSMINLINRKTHDSVETSELVHVTRGLDGSAINVEDLHEVIETLRDELRAVRDAFEEYKKERGP